MTTLMSKKLAEERAVAIEINGISYAIMMLTPHDLDDFALGFLLTEGIISQFRDVHDIQISSQKNDQDGEVSLLLEKTVVSVTLSNQASFLFKEKVRLLRGNTGCGVCGARSLDQHFKKLAPLANGQAFALDSLRALREKVIAYQILSQDSGAMHGAFLVSPKLDIVIAREDIGRHNALDKVIGQIVKSGSDTVNHALLLTSRCSSELVIKAHAAGVSTLMSFASASDLALDIAKVYQISIIHIPQKDAPYVYQP
jgi:FdhD protein